MSVQAAVLPSFKQMHVLQFCLNVDPGVQEFPAESRDTSVKIYIL